jgi:hypothetical protein
VTTIAVGGLAVAVIVVVVVAVAIGIAWLVVEARNRNQ